MNRGEALGVCHVIWGLIQRRYSRTKRVLRSYLPGWGQGGSLMDILALLLGLRLGLLVSILSTTRSHRIYSKIEAIDCQPDGLPSIPISTYTTRALGQSPPLQTHLGRTPKANFHPPPPHVGDSALAGNSSHKKKLTRYCGHAGRSLAVWITRWHSADTTQAGTQHRQRRTQHDETLKIVPIQWLETRVTHSGADCSHRTTLA